MTRPLAIINDTHIGVIRSAGTTPVTAYALRQYALAQFQHLLVQAEGCDLLINGDLFDTESIPYSDLLQTYTMLASWMIENPDSVLHLPPGNHDLSKTTTTMSSQQFLAKLMTSMFGARVNVPTEGCEIEVAGHRGWVIPHMPNQELFDLELAKVPDVKYLFVHANYDNHFAVNSDHSLNVSKEQAEKLPVERIVFGHEHQRRMELVGKVMVSGNQFPTSVADCLGNKDKVMTMITESKFEYLTTWVRDDSFQRVDWRELGNADTSAQFIRVEGEASDAEAPSVVTAISKLRKAHNAFVITNAVKVAGRDDSIVASSLENVANFNVVAELFKLLEKKNPAWAVKVKKIMEDNNVSAA